MEFFPDAGEITVGIKLVHWSSLHDHWSVDLILLYFAGRQNQDLVLECHSGAAWITEKERDFSCKMKSSDSERSIQKIAVNTCDTRNAATKSERIFMKFCRNLMNFEKFSTEDCCRTNSFQINGTRGKMSGINILGKSPKNLCVGKGRYDLSICIPSPTIHNLN